MKKRCPKTSQHQYDDDDDDNDGSLCFHLAKTGFYIQELNRIGLWPMPNTTTPKSIQDISDRFLRFSNYPARDTWEDGMLCDTARIDFEEHVLWVTKQVSESGPCLNCVKKGKIMSADGNCRAASLELCKNLF